MLRYSRRKEHCRVLGPGTRAVVWFHGCSRHCPGCIAREMNDSLEEILLSPAQLFQWIEGIQGIEGVTLSGGEPFEQPPREFIELLKLVKSDPRNLSILVFTGKYYKEIQADNTLSPALEYIDILVDGPFMEAQNDGIGLRGSNNQRILFLTERYRPLEKSLSLFPRRELELELNLEGELELSGIPKAGFMENFQKALKKEGCELR